MGRTEFPLAVERVVGLCIGLADYDAGDEERDLAVDLLNKWNPHVASALLRRVPKSQVRVVTGSTAKAIIEQLKALHDREFTRCDTIVQHGAFDLLRRSTGAMDKVAVVLGVFCESDGEPHVVVGAGLDMTLVARADAAPGDAAQARSDAQADAAVARLLRLIPRDAVTKLATLGAQVRSLALTERSHALTELDAHNAARRTVWGTQAMIIPVMAGTADSVMYALLNCIANDFHGRQARSVEIEGVEAIASGPPRPSGEVAGASAIRKLVITVYFPGAFGKHEIMRVGDDEYVGMPCTLEPGAAADLGRTRDVHVPAPFPHGIAAPRTAETPAWLERAILAIKRRPARTLTLGCLALFAASTLLTTVISLLGSHRTVASTERMPQQVLYSATLDGRPGVYGALVHPVGFQEARLRLVAGRFLAAGDFEPSALPIMVVSDRLVQSLFNGDRALVGRRVTLNGQATTIVGVVALQDPTGTLIDFWIPAR